ncbi:hypothetical protein DOY81_002042 [Sarcophaga bullata]|nr:hypothetical protein DOY81_002042 [Sarcophaga bullata]
MNLPLVSEFVKAKKKLKFGCCCFCYLKKMCCQQQCYEATIPAG